MPNYVPGVGPLNPKIMIIGEGPSRRDSETCEPFSDSSGYMLDEFLRSAGVSRSEVYLTNVVKYQPPFNDFKKLHLIGVDLEKSITELWDNEIHRIKPNVIIALGNHALEATTGYSGILKWRGSILQGKWGYKVIPSIHPSALSGGHDGGLSYTYAKIISFDIKRAVEESSSPDIHLPERNLRVMHNSLDVYRFFREYDHLDRAAVDIESVNCVPISIGFAFNRHHAISVPLFPRIGSYKLSDMSEDESDECWRLIDKELRRIRVIGQNFKYDEFKLSLIGFQTPRVYSDTLIKTRVIFPELPSKSLAMMASLWTREPYYKDDGKEYKFGKSSIDQLLLYNARDCAVTFEVDEEQESDLTGLAERYQVPLVDYYYNYMMRKHKFYLRMENNGFRVDHARKRELLKTYIELERINHARLVETVGEEINVKSYPQVFNLLYKTLGFKPFKNDPTSEDSIIKLLQTHCKGKDADKKKETLELLLEERRIRDQKSRYINFSPDYDGRCKSSFNIIATETCRSSTGILNKPVRPKKIGLAFHTISKHGRLAKDIRSMFIPDKGKVFLQADSSQAEARVVAVLSRDYELLEAFDKIDIHRRTAGLIFGLTQKLELGNSFIPIVDEIEKDGPERFCGKKTRHAGNYNMKEQRFMTEFNTDSQKFEIGMTISLWKSKDMLEKFHNGSPNIRNVFHAEIEDAITNTRCLIDPFGGVRIFTGRLDADLYKEGYANIPQRTVGHLVQSAGLDLYDELIASGVKVYNYANTAKENEDWEVMFVSENHDALLLQVPEDNWEPYARILKRLMQRPIDFSTYCSLKRDIQLVIPCDVEVSSTNYGELKKAKLNEVVA